MKILTIILLFFSSFVLADDDEKGHSVSFNTKHQQEVENDLMIVNLQIEYSHKDNQHVIDYINHNSSKIKTIVDQIFEIEMQTTGYNIYPQYKNNKIKSWRGNYNVKLKSKNFSKLTNTLTKLQNYANYNGVSFAISPELRQQLTDKMIEDAIVKHREKAQNIASSFGVKKYKFKTTNINTGGNFYPMRVEMAKASFASYDSTPSFGSGKSNISININSTIVLE
jgi:predicted secreted protein